MRAITLSGLLLVAACGDDSLGALNAALVVEPPSLDFGKVARASTKRVPLSLRNKGSFLLKAEGFTVVGPFSAPSEPLNINTGAVTPLEVSFTPTELGPTSGTLTIKTNDPDAPEVTVPLAGEGIEAAVVVEPASIDFGGVLWKRGTTAETRQVTVKNPGTDSFELTSLDLFGDGGGAFAVDVKDAVRTFAPQHSEIFEISYLPKAMGSTTGAARLRTTAIGALEVLVPITGTGVGPELEVCARVGSGDELCTDDGETPILDFGKVDRVSTTQALVKIKNEGTRDMKLVDTMLTGEGDDFHFSPELGTLREIILPPGSERQIEVTYTPSDYLYDSTFLGVASDSMTRPTARIRLNGEVQRPDIDVIPRGVSFSLEGQITRGTADVGIVNCGDAPLTLTSTPTLTQTRGPVQAFSLASVYSAGTVIQPEDCTNPAPSVVMTVIFETTTNGVYGAEISIGSDDPMEATVVVTLDATKR
ncbi:MAG: choice-of-anchor D domain-containing protein [Deltaproteobacteria bacterium]|nr:choice-of-anchor D domain-containing protein [Deltaproteobacteria bacterium]